MHSKIAENIGLGGLPLSLGLDSVQVGTTALALWLHDLAC
jgi:hypothetical protein